MTLKFADGFRRPDAGRDEPEGSRMAKTVLIVEDNADNLKLMSYLLRSFGHEVLVARDGTHGLEVADREALDR